MRIFTFLAALLVALSGCAEGSPLFRPRFGHEKATITSIKARFASKKTIAVVYEGVMGKTGKRENVFQFEKSVALDKALINLRFPVMDRSVIQSVLEASRLPDTGSFKQEDIEKMAKQSGAEILLIGFVFSTSNPSMFNSEKRDMNTILRAIDLKNYEVINSVQADNADQAVWRRLAPELLLLNEGN